MSVTLTLTSANMGDVSEEDFDAWAEYVAARIDEKTGLDVSVEQARFGEAGEDRHDNMVVAYGADPIDEALRALWEDFCADASAWPARTP